MKEPDRAEQLRRKIKSLQALYDYDSQKMGVWIHTSDRTYNRKVRNIESMRVSDLLRLEKVLHTNLIDVNVGMEKYAK